MIFAETIKLVAAWGLIGFLFGRLFCFSSMEREDRERAEKPSPYARLIQAAGVIGAAFCIGAALFMLAVISYRAFITL